MISSPGSTPSPPTPPHGFAKLLRALHLPGRPDPRDTFEWSAHRGEPLLLKSGGHEPEVGTLLEDRTGRDGAELHVRTLHGEQWVPAREAKVPRRLEPTHRLDLGTQPQARHSFERHLERDPWSFPHLQHYKWEAQSSSSPEYNCIANSVGVESQWLWPGSSLKAFDSMYAEYGFVPTEGLDFSLRENVEKVVLFGEGHVPPRPTHAIRQEPDGAFSSKNGELARIRIMDPAALEGGSYGRPVRVYARYRPDPKHFRGFPRALWHFRPDSKRS